MIPTGPLFGGKLDLKHFLHSCPASTSAIRTEQSLPDTGQGVGPEPMTQAGLRLDWSSSSPEFWGMIISPKEVPSSEDMVGSVSWGSEAYLGKSELTMPRPTWQRSALKRRSLGTLWKPSTVFRRRARLGYTTGYSSAMTLPRETPSHMRGLFSGMNCTCMKRRFKRRPIRRTTDRWWERVSSSPSREGQSTTRILLSCLRQVSLG